MAYLNVNPTRMELKKLKTRLTSARRGHKLLKDKRDELMKQFLDIVREAKDLRRKLEGDIGEYNSAIAVASALTDKRVMTESLMLPKNSGATERLKISERNIMSVIVPVFEYEDAQTDVSQAIGVNYGYAFTSAALDDAVAKMTAISAQLIHLAQLEKSASLLCEEIERTRRRVNALEYIMIPQLEEGIKRIVMKLDENERGNITRLMKVKDMMVKKAVDHSHDEDE